VLALLRRYPDFRRLWLAQVVSQGGDWLSRMAVLALIGSLGGSAAGAGVGALFGVELALRLLPTAVFGPLAGAVADRVSRRALMVTTDIARAGIVLLMLFVDEPGELPVLYVLVFAQMGLAIFFNAARAAALPSTVSGDDLHGAYTLSAATWSAMLTIGSLLGGVLLAQLGVGAVFYIDAGTYLVSALVLLRLRLPPSSGADEPFRWREVLLFADLARAWRHARSRSVGRAVLAKTYWGTAGGYLVLLSVAGSTRFAGALDAPPERAALGAAGLATGMLYAARGFGTGLGPVLARRVLGSRVESLRLQIALGFFLAALAYLGFGVAPSLTLACAFVVLAHMGGSTLWVASTTWWQGRVEDEFRGRVFALEFLGMTVAFTAGGVLSGMVYDATGSLLTAVCVTSAATVISGLLWLHRAHRRPLEPTREDAAVAETLPAG